MSDNKNAVAATTKNLKQKFFCGRWSELTLLIFRVHDRKIVIGRKLFQLALYFGPQEEVQAQP